MCYCLWLGSGICPPRTIPLGPKDELSKLDDSKLLYTVEIPDDTGNNYIEEKQTLQDLNHPDMAGRIDKVMDDYLGAKDFWNSWQTPGWAMREEFIRMAMGQHPEMSRGDAERKYSELLSKAGVVGVHYNGRKDGDCYVIFDDNDLKITDKVKFFQTPNGDTYGYALGGKIYIDPKIATAETPIHEYAHLWSEVLRKGNPEEWKNVVGLMKQETVIWDDVKKNYPHLESDDDIADEVLATYSGRQGAKKLRAIRDGIVDSEDTVANKRVALSSLERFRQLLSRLWKDIVDLLHIHFTTAEDVADKVMYDLLNGVNPEKIQVPSQLGSSIADRNDYVDASTDEVTVYPKRIKEWLSKESIDRARGKSKEDIIGMFGNEPVPIAYVPKDYLYVLGDNVTDNRIYSGKGYFIDHALNHHPQIDVKTYDYMQEVLAHPNDIKTTNNGVAFIKKIDQWNAVVVSVEKAKDGKIIWHKSFYDQKKEIYKNRPSIMKRGLSADATPSINPANKAFGSKRSISALDNPNAKIENISDIDVNKGENLSEGSKISFQFIGEHDSASRDKSPERTTRMDNLHITSEIEAVNRRFNEELDAFKNNTSKGLLHLGSPSSILRACGVDVMELTLSPSVLHQHLKKHGLKTDDLKGLVKGLQTPMLVYKHGLNVPNIVVVTELNSPKGKLSVALRLNPYGKVVEMSNISSIHGKDVTMEIDRLYTLGETLRKALRYVDKEKVSSWMMSSPYMEAGTSGNQKLFSVAKIINDFENPVKKDENLSNDPKIRFQFIGKHGTDIDNKSQITMKTPTQPLLSPLYHAMEYSRMHDGMWLLPNDKELPVSSSPYDDLMTMFKIKANESDTHMKLMSERIQLEQSLPSSKKIYFDALSLSRKVGKSEGFRVEMYLKTLESHYDTKNDKIKYTMIPTEDLTHMPRFLVASRANDLYRAVVAATGSSSRLDRSHRDLLPDDAAAHEALVRDIAASVLMSRQGLPATLSKEVKDKLDYYERELKENPSYESTLKQDVDTTIKVIEMAVKEERVDFRDFRRSRQNAFDPHTHSIVQALATFPNAESREIVVVKDEGAGKADVILPQGASLEVWNEAPCLHKEDITEALSKQGIDNVRYFNANGSLRLRETNDYFKDKDVFLANYSKHSLNVKKSLDFTKAIRKTNDKVIEKFRCIKDDTGKYAFFLKPEGESSFSIYPTKEQRNRYFMSANEEKTDRDKIRYDISQEAYRYARDHPAEKHELIMPRVSPGIDMSRISHARLTRDARSGNTYIKAEIDGVAHTQKISNEQWSRLWLADDMKNYKISLAAHVFASVLIKSEGQVTASAPSVQADEVRIHSDAIDNSQEQDEEEVRRPVFHL